MKISKMEYEVKFKEYLRECGPNPGTSFFGKWGWYVMKKREFNAMLKDKGIEVNEFAKD